MTICIPGRQLKPSVAASVGARRMLVTVTVQGSAGPIRFVVSEGDPVGSIVGTTLRCYAREGRFPPLGCDVREFHLFCAHCDSMDPLDPSDPIGANGDRKFVLCKKRLQQSALPVPSMAAGTAAVVAAEPRRRRAAKQNLNETGDQILYQQRTASREFYERIRDSSCPSGVSTGRLAA